MKFKQFKILALAIALVVGGMLVNGAFAESGGVDITEATGGEAVSIDTTSATGGEPVWASLTGPIITESAVGDIKAGDITLTLPDGWELNPLSVVAIGVTGGGELALSGDAIQQDAKTISFNIETISSTELGTLTFTNIQVRPTGTTISTGIITQTAGEINGVINGETSFGTLTTVPGEVTKLAFEVSPSSSTVYGSLFAEQPVVRTCDQFGNYSTETLGTESKTVTLSLTSGLGELLGEVELEIVTGDEKGVARFSGLTIGSNGGVAVGEGKTLTATASTLVSAVSEVFAITEKTLTATVTGEEGVKVYDGNNEITINECTLQGVVEDDDVDIEVLGTATFEDKHVGENKTITMVGFSLSGDAAGNYSSTELLLTGKITERPITITAQSDTKVYDGTINSRVAPVSEELQEGDSFATLPIQTFDTKKIGTGKTLTPSGALIDDGNEGLNYHISYIISTEGVITKPASSGGTSVSSGGGGGATLQKPITEMTQTEIRVKLIEVIELLLTKLEQLLALMQQQS